MTILLFLCEMAALQICLAAFFVGRILFQEAKNGDKLKQERYIRKTKSLEEKSLQGSESGGYLLSHNKCSTIGVAELNDPVRNGKGWDLSAITTSIYG